MDYAFYEDTIDLDTLKEMLGAYRELKGLQKLDGAAAWEEFQLHYSEREETFPLPPNYPDNSKQTVSDIKPVNHRRRGRLLRLGVAAATVVILSAVFVTFAFGGSFWSSLIQRTRETFGFVAENTPPQINERLKSLHDALVNHGITDPVAPAWLPDGFELTDFSVFDMPTQVSFAAYFKDGEQSIVIQVVAHNDINIVLHEKSGENDVLYKRNNIEHHIMANEDKVSVVWVNKNYECSISGDFTVDDAKSIINSIYER